MLHLIKTHIKLHTPGTMLFNYVMQFVIFIYHFRFHFIAARAKNKAGHNKIIAKAAAMLRMRNIIALICGHGQRATYM